jgi:hypothetical protein
MSCRPIYVKLANASGAGVGYYDLVDNEGEYVLNNISSTSLATGVTLSVDSAVTSFRLTNFRQSATYSTCNPLYYNLSNVSFSGGTYSACNAPKVSDVYVNFADYVNIINNGNNFVPGTTPGSTQLRTSTGAFYGSSFGNVAYNGKYYSYDGPGFNGYVAAFVGNC